MTSHPTAPSHSSLTWRVVLGCLLLPTLGFSQVIWDNSNADNAWGTAANWSTSAVPTSASNVQFNATETDAIVNNISLASARSANSLTYNNVDDTFSIINGSGSRTLTLTSGDITRTAGSSGTQTIANTTLALGGSSVMDISGSGSLTISAAVTGSGISMTKTGTGELILSGANTFSGGTTVSAGTLTLASTAALASGSNLTLSGGTLKLSTTSVTLNTLTVTATSTIDFGGANASLNLTNLSIATGVTLNIINWVAASDTFITTNWLDGGAGAGVHDTTGATPMNQVVFASFSGNDTIWLTSNNSISPVPEPSTYGAILLSVTTGLMFWRRQRVSHRTA